MPRIRKTVLTIEVDDQNFTVYYTGKIVSPETKAEHKHDFRLMDALIANEQLLNFFLRLINPVIRYKRNEARKKAQNQKS